jgi:hypothetical protein
VGDKENAHEGGGRGEVAPISRGEPKTSASAEAGRGQEQTLMDNQLCLSDLTFVISKT